jgi:hypothetical protein
MSLWNINHASECRAQLDELIDFCEATQLELTQDTIEGLEDRLRGLLSHYSPETESQMSPIEREYFYPALREACTHAPSLKYPMRWADAVTQIEAALKRHRPPEQVKQHSF